MSVLALVPARKGSKGCPGKNWRLLGGRSLLSHAINCGREAGCEVAVTTDGVIECAWLGGFVDAEPPWPAWFHEIKRPAKLAQDDTPMIDVVKHALSEIPGPSDQIIVLLQPTQPLRTPAHVKAAIEMLRQPDTEAVVSLVEVPRTHSPRVVISAHANGYAHPWDCAWYELPTRRQDVKPVYIRDGTVYAFYRRTIDEWGSIYGGSCYVRPLIIPPEETCELDTEADWLSVERRWHERTRQTQRP